MIYIMCCGIEYKRRIINSKECGTKWSWPNMGEATVSQARLQLTTSTISYNSEVILPEPNWLVSGYREMKMTIT
jgi:hypothetical protein